MGKRTLDTDGVALLGILRAAVVLTCVVALFAVWMLPAPADGIGDDVAGDNPDRAISVGVADPAGVVAYTVWGFGPAQGDPQPGCNASDGTPAVLTFNITALDPADAGAATATPNSLTMTACGSANSRTVQYEATRAGSYAVNVTVEDAGTTYNETYGTVHASFTLDAHCRAEGNTVGPPSPSTPDHPCVN